MNVLSLAQSTTFLDHLAHAGLLNGACVIRKVSKAVEKSSCAKDQYHQAAVCFCKCTLEHCLSQTDCPLVWVISKYVDHKLSRLCLSDCGHRSTARMFPALPCLDSIFWPPQQDRKALGQLKAAHE